MGKSDMKIPKDDYQEYHQWKSMNRAQSSSTTTVSTACDSHSTTNQSPWIIDSGASDHITGNNSMFSSMSPLRSPHLITLTDGSRIAPKGIDQVLFIPNCPFNLISLSQLTKSLNCSFCLFLCFFNEIKNQFGRIIKIFRSDNAKEYFSSELSFFLPSQGVLHQSTCPHKPQQNGIEKRKNRHLVETTCTLMLREKLLSKEIITEFVNSSEQLVDVMTKSLRGPQIQFLCSKLGAYNYMHQLEGEC
uniref:Retrovirus-related Pol polyprotein from transposon TNT 1-94 n=1 Tax=Cajanus cajan TaxID=3821 RepID=A0A151SB76_CAJCA|nr:Retrovirus-related Pol polyprotein from transposon TNT 1-94 [Cajanus cajan]